MAHTSSISSSPPSPSSKDRRREESISDDPMKNLECRKEIQIIVNINMFRLFLYYERKGRTFDHLRAEMNYCSI